MQQIINFIIRNKAFLLYVLLLSVSLLLTIQSHSYHKSKFLNSANFLSGGVYSLTHGVTQYFDLKEQNKALAEENNRLKEWIYINGSTIDSMKMDSLTTASIFKFTTATVIKNSFSATNNYLTINKGKRDSIFQDFGVISAKGIVGIVDNSSRKYARVMSVLNTNSRINAQLKKTNHFGTLTWNGKSFETVQLIDIPKQAPVKPGDTIVTGGLSTIFPKGILIGSVQDFALDETGNYYIVEVKLFNDMTNLGHVHVIENKDAKEINALDNTDE
ncbi:MAG TPA: rod shape-determining protein MreC [Flavobacteriaceae bacterium]|nr:rod shape-determining protein MreC [Flavobacteriaceae bacterium]